MTFTYKKIGWTALLLTLVFAACSDEHETINNTTGKQLAFTAVTQELYQEQQKSASRSGTDFPAITTAEVEALDGITAPNGDPLYLHTLTTDSIGLPQVSTKDASRAKPITTAEMYSEIGLFVYTTAGSWAADSASLAPSIYNVKATKSGSVWKAPTARWEEGKKHTIMAYAPHGTTGATFSAQTVTGSPVLTYEVPSAVANQNDLLIAKQVDAQYNEASTHKLTFQHALTAVTFAVGTDFTGGTITSISLQNVYGKADFNMGAQKWSNHSNPTTYTQTLNVGAVSSTTKAKITDGEATFMLLPQTLPANAKLVVGYTDSITNTARTLSIALSGTWIQGKTKLYTLSTKSISVTKEFSVVALDTVSQAYTGGTTHFKVTSKITVAQVGGTSASKEIGWTTEYLEEGSTVWTTIKPAWLTAMTETGTGSNASALATIAAQTNTAANENEHTTALRTATPVANFNLSFANGSTGQRNTANCYVINAPGTYKLPLIYGNAYKGGNVNTNAFKTSATGTDVLTAFVNHANMPITAPWIKDNKNADGTLIVPDKCTLVWQDVDGLITNVGKDGDCMTFTVPQSTIRQGNAVLAVKDANNTILWSWHIWVTDYKLGSDDRKITGSDKEYTIMPYNVGWCDEEVTGNYKARSVKVRFTQTGTNAQDSLTLTQTAHKVYKLGDNPYYQWGRKDPMRAAVRSFTSSTASTTTDKTLYTSGYTYGTEAGTTTINNAIQRPHIFFTSTYPATWATTYSNLWSANEATFTQLSTTPRVKTIYDPSPVGYMVMSPHVYNKMTTTNAPWNSTNLGRIYTDASTGESVSFPAMGVRAQTTGAVDRIGTHGYYDSSLCYIKGGRWAFLAPNSNSSFTITDKSNTGWGFSVRAVKE